MQGMSLPLAVLLSLAAPVGIAAAQDPARVDGSQVADPAAVFARPARPQPSSGLTRTLAPRQDSMLGQLFSSETPHGIAPLSPESYRQAYGNADVRSRLGRTYSSGLSGTSGSGNWLQQLMAPGDGRQQGQDLSLQQGMRTAQDAMDEMGRQLMPALRDLKREFDSGLQRASSRD
jgi:hypothetical protein